MPNLKGTNLFKKRNMPRFKKIGDLENEEVK